MVRSPYGWELKTGDGLTGDDKRGGQVGRYPLGNYLTYPSTERRVSVQRFRVCISYLRWGQWSGAVGGGGGVEGALGNDVDDGGGVFATGGCFVV